MPAVSGETRSAGVLAGQEEVFRRLQSQIAGNRVSHAYLIEGDKGSGKRTLARYFAKSLVCRHPEGGRPCGTCDSCAAADSGNHPDIRFIRTEENTLTVGQIREELVQDMEILPYYSGRKVYVVEDADKMNLQAQNALLKTIEEPPEYGVVLLLSVNPEGLLPTVRSRLIRIRLLALAEERVAEILSGQYGFSGEEALFGAATSGGSVGKALSMLRSGETKARQEKYLHVLENLSETSEATLFELQKELEADKASIGEVLGLFRIWFRDLIVAKESGSTDRCFLRYKAEALAKEAGHYSAEALYELSALVEDAEKKISHNVNYGLWSDLFLLELAGRNKQ